MSPTLFEQATRIFDGWTDPETGNRVLRIIPRNEQDLPLAQKGGKWMTKYHQYVSIFEGGRRISLPCRGKKGSRDYLVDLTTGEAVDPLPPEYGLIEVHPSSPLALCWQRKKDVTRILLRDLNSQCNFSAIEHRPGWSLGEAHLLSDGRRAIVQEFQGQFGFRVNWAERCNTRFYLLDADGPTRVILDEDGNFCNHFQSCPTNPETFSFDRWPTPKPNRFCPVVIHIRDLDGTFETPLPQGNIAPPVGQLWGGQRDHYVWTPDGRRIASYFSPLDAAPGDSHFEFNWWISVMDWQTGEDLAAAYPPERWGAHYAITPDSRFVFSCGGVQFPSAYAVDLSTLARGWNEQILCTYPQTDEEGSNNGPYHFPFVLPDQSGGIFAAGWHNEETWGTYLVEWPAELRT